MEPTRPGAREEMAGCGEPKISAGTKWTQGWDAPGGLRCGEPNNDRAEIVASGFRRGARWDREIKNRARFQMPRLWNLANRRTQCKRAGGGTCPCLGRFQFGASAPASMGPSGAGNGEGRKNL